MKIDLILLIWKKFIYFVLKKKKKVNIYFFTFLNFGVELNCKIVLILRFVIKLIDEIVFLKDNVEDN